MDFNSRFQQMTMASQKQGLNQAQGVRQTNARPVVLVSGSGSSVEKTYMNVTPVAMASRQQGGQIQLVHSKGPISRLGIIIV